MKRPTVTLHQAETLEEIRITVESRARVYWEAEVETIVDFNELYVQAKFTLHKAGWIIAHRFFLKEFGMLVDMKAALNFQVDKLIKQLEERSR